MFPYMVAESYRAWGEEASAIIPSITSRLATSTCKPKSVVLYGQMDVQTGLCKCYEDSFKDSTTSIEQDIVVFLFCYLLYIIWNYFLCN